MWIFNIFLYLCFVSNPLFYDALVQAGAPCYVYDTSEVDNGGEQPICQYDISNINPGRIEE